jgi:hypothetical protein
VRQPPCYRTPSSLRASVESCQAQYRSAVPVSARNAFARRGSHQFPAVGPVLRQQTRASLDNA